MTTTIETKPKWLLSLLACHQIGDRYFECASTVDNRAVLRRENVCWNAAILNNGQFENCMVIKFVI